ncbi:MAG: fused MFS/spermidine synthase [Smithella sp.]|nr:fused MFS/spermidine synthase [Smithella sp.]
MKKIVFALFFLSGFCGLLYQVVWMRMAFASFGVITPVLSVMISVFMLGLGLGSFFGGRLIAVLTHRFKKSPILFYAVIELLIGVGAFAVPKLFSMGETWLLGAGEMDSLQYLILSDVIIGVSVLPWCILMGFTYPFMMAFIKNLDQSNTSSFSYLYLANVIGAMCGTSLTAWVLIELTGFYNSLMIAGFLNFSIFIASLFISVLRPYQATAHHETTNNESILKQHVPKNSSFIYVLLFLTGFIAMAMEVVWVRAFTPVMLTTIYAFASLLTVYLFATWAGAFFYRRHLERNKVLSTGVLLGCLSISAFLPIAMNDPRLIMSATVALISIFPFCAVLGYLTPKLIDEYSSGRPTEAGKAYAVNILGCVIGPLFASYIFLPQWGEKASLLILGLPFLALFVIYYHVNIVKEIRLIAISVIALCIFFISAFINIGYVDFYIPKQESVIRRDHTATVVSAGEGLDKMLLVNGIGITSLTPITKMMAHLPLAFLKDKPGSALVICLGMGTTYRSALSWDIRVIAVELVPSVKDAFGYYFADAETIMKNPKGKIIVDDGRRFLNRTKETFDIITIDPPPPLEAAGSSLLYSEEFYRSVKTRLKPNGILQQWFPCGEFKILQAIARSLTNSFEHVRVFRSVEGWGLHFLASASPIDVPSVQTMLSRIPPAAQKDMIEWYDVDGKFNLEGFIQFALSSEIPLDAMVKKDTTITITDDRPFNEYFFLRRKIDTLRGEYVDVSCDPLINH